VTQGRASALRARPRRAPAWLAVPLSAACALAALAPASLVPASLARADAMPAPLEQAPTLGLSGAWVSGADDTPGGAMLGVDFAYFYEHYWASAGTRLRLESDGVGAIYPYVEAGAWYLVNVGLGYSLGLADGRKPWSNVHLFVGVPIPLATEGTWILPYVEPYYRPMLGDGVVVHEVGVLIKGVLLSEDVSTSNAARHRPSH